MNKRLRGLCTSLVANDQTLTNGTLKIIRAEVNFPTLFMNFVDIQGVQSQKELLAW